MFNFLEKTSDYTLLTPNSRLSRYLRRECAEQFMESDSDAIVMPSIMPVQSWLQNVYRDHSYRFEASALFLSVHQERLIWQTMIANTEQGAALLQTEPTAKLVQQAYRMLIDWRVPLSALNEHDNVDTKALGEWIIGFEDYCAQNHVISSAKIITLLTDNIQHLSAIPSTPLILYAFDEISPALAHFFERLGEQQATIEHYKPNNAAVSQHSLEYRDIKEEVFAMAHWAKQAYQACPKQKILCVVPNLTHIRPLIIKTFANVFSPGDFFSFNHAQTIYNISGGYQLAQAPVIYLALKILQLNSHSITIDSLTLLLTTPFISGFLAEDSERAQFDFIQRERNFPVLTGSSIIEAINVFTKIPLLQKQFTAFIEGIDALPKTQTLSFWQNKIYQLLTLIGWPGERSLNSEEHQQVKRFYNLIQELPTLDLNNRSFSYGEAVTLLRELARNTLFEIESFDGPVQVLGLLEAAGISNDKLWLMHLDDETWPARPNPNPFIAFPLQSQYRMPHCNAARELDFAKRFMTSLRMSNAECYYSYHRHEDDKLLSKSPLLNDPTIIRIDPINLDRSQPILPIQIIKEGIQLIYDDKGPALEETVAKGGTGLFKSQAACPFQAFARYRLRAKPLPTPEIGLTYAERGILLHHCLDKLWKALGSQTVLLQLAYEKLSVLVKRVVEETIEALFSHRLQPVFKSLELTRLQILLLAWLALEKNRPPFEIVAHEQSRQIQIGQLNVNIKLDRLDMLANGQKLIIDYKSGLPSLADWFGERPKEPQLPLYCLSEPDIDAVTFAQVRIDKPTFKGVSADELQIKGILTLEKARRYDAPETWKTLINHWVSILDAIGHDYSIGNACVDPVAYNTCEQCEMQSLCRINERKE